MVTKFRSVLIISAVIAALFPVVVEAQGTAVPYVIGQYFDNNGDPLNGGRLCTFAAGTSTLAATYTTAALNVANANPVPLNNAGRPTNGVTTVGIFLTPGTSYKLVLKDSTTTTCVPDTGVTIWSVDNVMAVPASSVNVDIDGTAGEALTAGQIVYLANGAASTTAGSWYRADADLSYSGPLPQLGVAVNDISSGASGSIRLSGRVTGLSALTPGGYYFVSSTAGSLTITPPNMARLVGQADSATSLVLQPNPRSTPIKPRAPCGRLTLTSGTPVTTADVTAATTVYYAPYGGCTSATVYNGSDTWYQINFTQLSIAVPATTAQLYDVFAYDNAGTFALELTAWTNDTTRATALTTQDGVYVKTGDTTRLYLGSFRTTGVSGQTEDSLAKRYVWNYYNRVPRPLRVMEATNNWVWDTASYQQARATATNQLDVVIGVAEVPIHVRVDGFSGHTVGSVTSYVSIGEDSTTTPATGVTGMPITITAAATIFAGSAELRKFPAVGRHVYVWLEYGAGATTVFYGDNGTPTLLQSGISGEIDG